MKKKELAVQALTSELRETLTHQLAPIYTWKIEGQRLSLYDVCDELITTIELMNFSSKQADPDLVKNTILQALAQLEQEGYLTLEAADIPVEEILMEPRFLPEAWESSYLDELPLYYHEEDPGLEEYCFE